MALVKEYFGRSLSKDECWPLELSVHEQHRTDEAALCASRWFDYRQLLPSQATYLFAAQYRYEYIEAYKRVKDIRTADTVSAFSPDDIFKSTDLTALWLARREADAIGCKYDFYLRLAFERFADRGWKNLPRPNQLYSEELSQDVKNAWAKRCREVLQLADSAFFSCDAYVAHPDQVAYHEWVIEQIKAREHKHLALSRALRFDALPISLADKVFGTELVKRAQKFYTAT